MKTLKRVTTLERHTLRVRPTGKLRVPFLGVRGGFKRVEPTRPLSYLTEDLGSPRSPGGRRRRGQKGHDGIIQSTNA